MMDLLGFQSPLCGLLQQRGPIHKKKRARVVSVQGADALALTAGRMGRMPAHPFMSHRSDGPCHRALGL